PPPSPYRGLVFGGRDREIDRAEALLLDAPHNLLLSGLFGVGKTIFVEELLRGIQDRYTHGVLTVYECLDSTGADFLTTILRGLARKLRNEDAEALSIDRLLT